MVFMEKKVDLKFFINRARQEPYLILPGIIALINGHWHKFKFFLLRKKIRIGKWFRVYGKFNFIGCGSVTIGDNCFIISNLFKPVVFSTVLPNARIEIGNNVGFSGTTIQCFKHISVDDWCNIADGYIVDSKAHSVSADRRFIPAQDVPSASVRLEKNVWISTKVVICHGVTIGENSVIGACSLVRSDIPSNSFYAGNPARFIRPVPPRNESINEDIL